MKRMGGCLRFSLILIDSSYKILSCPILKAQSLACGGHDTDRHPSSPISIRFRCSYNLIQHHTIPSEYNIYLEFHNENLLKLMGNALAHGGHQIKEPINAVHFSGLQQVIGSPAQARLGQSVWAVARYRWSKCWIWKAICCDLKMHLQSDHPGRDHGAIPGCFCIKNSSCCELYVCVAPASHEYDSVCRFI